MLFLYQQAEELKKMSIGLRTRLPKYSYKINAD